MLAFNTVQKQTHVHTAGIRCNTHKQMKSF